MNIVKRVPNPEYVTDLIALSDEEMRVIRMGLDFVIMAANPDAGYKLPVIGEGTKLEAELLVKRMRERK